MRARSLEIRAGPVDAIPVNGAVTVRAGGREVAVFNLGDRLVAVDHRCAHRGGPIAEGHVREGIVTCPWHWWRYDLSTGERLGAPGIRLGTYRVRVVEGEVVVEVPPAEEPGSIRELLLRHAREWKAANP